MLNKGWFPFFKTGTSKKFQICSQKLPWSNIVNRIETLRQAIAKQSFSLWRSSIRNVSDNLGRERLKQYHWIRGFYSRFYDRGTAQRMPKYLVCGSVLTTSRSKSFDWEKEKLSESESKNYFDHIDQCHDIREKTITCQQCHHRLRIESEVPNVTYCKCKDAPKSVYGKKSEDCDWTPFIERKDILVWRREHQTMKGNYEYKMYGSFDDVSAEEFLSVQLDMSEFRLSWDKSSAQCVVIDRDTSPDNNNGIVYYWEVNWPRFFSNRDYCCYREHQQDPDTGAFLVLSKSVDHPNCPTKKKTWRVQDYFSVLVIKPHTTCDKPGLEFCLTGYENPGLQLPEAIITYVAVRGMPEFMINLRAACIKLRQQNTSPSAGRAQSNDITSKESPVAYQDTYQQRMSQSPMYA